MNVGAFQTSAIGSGWHCANVDNPSRFKGALQQISDRHIQYLERCNAHDGLLIILSPRADGRDLLHLLNGFNDIEVDPLMPGNIDVTIDVDAMLRLSTPFDNLI